MRPKLEVLMSVMHQKDFSIAYKTKIDSDLLIINQCDVESYEEIKVNGHLWRMISTKERGSSKSRNMALANARGEICLLCDDDEIMEDGYAEIILKAFDELPQASSIVFNLERINYSMNKTYYWIDEIKKAPAYRSYGSPMCAFRRSAIFEKGICFNEKFGSGSPWGGGEDCLFQRDITKNKLKIYEYPAKIATVDYSGGSMWFSGYSEKYFYNVGAFIQYRYGINIVIKELECLYLCYKLRREKALSPLQKYRWMHKGMRGIKKDVTYNEYIKGKK